MDKRYHYKNRIIEVLNGLGDVFIVGWRGENGNGFHRLSVSALPVCVDKVEAQMKLDVWAKSLRLKKVEGSDNG